MVAAVGGTVPTTATRRHRRNPRVPSPSRGSAVPTANMLAQACAFRIAIPTVVECLARPVRHPWGEMRLAMESAVAGPAAKSNSFALVCASMRRQCAMERVRRVLTPVMGNARRTTASMLVEIPVTLARCRPELQAQLAMEPVAVCFAATAFTLVAMFASAISTQPPAESTARIARRPKAWTRVTREPAVSATRRSHRTVATPRAASRSFASRVTGSINPPAKPVRAVKPPNASATRCRARPGAVTTTVNARNRATSPAA
jgi:hypothetical protein